MNVVKRIFVFCCICCLGLVTACGSSVSNDSAAGNGDNRSAKELVRELIYANGNMATVDTNKNQELLSLLEKKDAKLADTWRSILDYMNKAYGNGFVNRDVLPDDLAKDDSLCLVVLGFELNPDGTMQPELIERLKVAIINLKKYPKAWILVAGGGTALNNRNVTEADLMAEWLKNQGVNPDRIIVENKSMDTLANAENSLNILSSKYPQVKDLAIITSDYHMPWGAVNYFARLAYNEYSGVGSKYNIVSNASCHIVSEKYTKAVILSYQRDQLWTLAQRY